jgi:hypothetical protein
VTALTRCKGPNGTGCPENALVRPGRTCGECAKRSKPKPDPKPQRQRSPRGRIEALIESANSEAVQAERAAWRKTRRR